LITLSTTADNFDRRRKDESYCELLEVVGVLLQLRLTGQNKNSAAVGALIIVGAFGISNLRSADKKTLWSIQRTLTSKKYRAKPSMRSVAPTQDWTRAHGSGRCRQVLISYVVKKVLGQVDRKSRNERR